MIDADGRALGVTTANWLDPPFNRWGFRHVPQLARTAPIPRGPGPVRELPRAERDLDGFAFEHGGRRFLLPEMLAETLTDGFLLIQDGAVVTERYLDGMRASDTHLLMSCSKSLTSTLLGVVALACSTADTTETTIASANFSGTFNSYRVLAAMGRLLDAMNLALPDEATREADRYRRFAIP